jgi:hypothetical protein
MKIALGIGAAAILAVSALWWRLDAVSSERDEARTQRDTALQGLSMAISEAAKNEAIMSALAETREAIAQDNRRTRAALADLERSNEEVRSFLDTPVPDDLAGLVWGDTTSAGDPAGPAERADPPVQGGRKPPR